jgi:hypothetical protein
MLNQQVQANQSQQARTVLEGIASAHWPVWSKFGLCEEIADLLKGRRRGVAGLRSTGRR